MSTVILSSKSLEDTEDSERDVSNDQINDFLDTFYFWDDDELELIDVAEDATPSPDECDTSDGEDEELYDLYSYRERSRTPYLRPTLFVTTVFTEDDEPECESQQAAARKSSHTRDYESAPATDSESEFDIKGAISSASTIDMPDSETNDFGVQEESD